MDHKQFQAEIKNILLDIYIDMSIVDVHATFHQTKKRIDAILLECNLNTETSDLINEISDLCFNLWSPMCENTLSTYQDIQNQIIPKLETVLEEKYQLEIGEELITKAIKIIDFNSLNELPSLPMFKDLIEDIFDDDEFNIDLDDFDDEKEWKEWNMELDEMELDENDFDYYAPEEEKYTHEDGPYCGSCQQAPCMCSDPERTSMTLGF